MEATSKINLSKHVYLLNKTVLSNESSYYGGEKLDYTQDANDPKSINDSEFPTEKKNFKSDVNPHILKRNNQLSKFTQLLIKSRKRLMMVWHIFR